MKRESKNVYIIIIIVVVCNARRHQEKGYATIVVRKYNKTRRNHTNKPNAIKHTNPPKRKYKNTV